MPDFTPTDSKVHWPGVSPVALKMLFLGIYLVLFSVAIYVLFIFTLEHITGLKTGKDKYLQYTQIKAYQLQHQVNEQIVLLEQRSYLPDSSTAGNRYFKQEVNHTLDSLQALIGIWQQPQALQISTALRLSMHHYHKLIMEALLISRQDASNGINAGLANKIVLELRPQADEIDSQISDLLLLLQNTLDRQKQNTDTAVASLERLMLAVLCLGMSITCYLAYGIMQQTAQSCKAAKQHIHLLQTVQQELQVHQLKLAEKELLLRGITENTSDGIYAINRQYQITMINHIWQAKLAAKGIYLRVGQDCRLMFSGEGSQWKEPFEQAFAGEKNSTSASHQQITNELCTETHYHPVRDEQGAIQGVVVFVQDITSRKGTEAQLEKLLEEAYLKTEEMKAQESLLRDTLTEMQQSQEALQYKEAHLSAVINNTDDKIIAIDTDYTITFINASLKEQCARKGIILTEGSDYRQIFERVDEKEWKPNCERAFAGEKFTLRSVQNVLEDGLLEVAFNPVKNRKGIVTGVCIFVHDITHQVKAEQQIQKLYVIEQESNEELQAQQEELRQNLEELISTQEELEKTQHIIQLKEARLRALINNTSDAIFSVDAQYTITVINQAMKDMYKLRYTHASEGDSFLKYLPAEKKQLWKECFDKSLQGEQFVITWEDTPYAESLYHELSFNPVKTDTHEIVGVSVFIKDITERRKQDLEKIKLLSEAEHREEELLAQGEMMRDNLYELMITRDELEKKEAQLSSQMNAINNSNNIVEFDLEGNIIYANDNFLQLVHYSEDELKGKNYQILIPDEEQNVEANIHLWHTLKRGEFYAGEFRRLTKTGEPIWMRATYNPVSDAQGKPYKIVKFAFDVTDRVQDAIEKKGLYEKISLDAEELRMQEEELRQNLEELKITQEALLQQKEHIQDKEARLRALIDNTEDDIYAIDTNYSITILNKAIYNRYEKQGLSLQVGYNVFSIIPAAATAYWKVNFDKAIGGEKFSIVDQILTKDGEVYYDVSLNPIRNDRNQVIGVSVLSRNINQYKMAEKENLQTIDVLRKIQERVATMSSDKENEIEEYKKKVEKLKGEMSRKLKV